MTMRGRKAKPGRITFVGSGPGDPGLLTARAQTVLAQRRVGVHRSRRPRGRAGPDRHRTAAGVRTGPAAPAKADAAADDARRDAAGTPDAAQAAVIAGGPEVRPALGDPAEVAKTLVAEARHGYDVVRLVAGDPLSVDAVITEIGALAKTHLNFEIVPGLPATTAVPTYAGLPLGSSHTVADVRGDVDWAALAAAPGPLILHATASHLPDAARTLIEYGLADSTPAVVTANGTTCQQRSVETTLGGLLDKAVLEKPAGSELAGPLVGPLVVTIGKTVANRAKLNWWESRALYGWTVLVPRTKDQAGEMSDRLVGHGALPIEVPTIAVEPPRSPAQMERAVKGLVDGRFQWVVFTSTNAVRAVWEKFNEFGLDARAFSGVKIACVGQATADKVRAFGINPELVPVGRAVLARPARRVPAVRRGFRSGQPGAAAAGRHRHRDTGRGPARAWLGDRGRHRLPHRARGSAAGADPRDDQDRWVRRGLLHLELDGAQPGRHRRQAPPLSATARPDHRGLHRPKTAETAAEFGLRG